MNAYRNIFIWTLIQNRDRYICIYCVHICVYIKLQIKKNVFFKVYQAINKVDLLQALGASGKWNKNIYHIWLDKVTLGNSYIIKTTWLWQETAG